MSGFALAKECFAYRPAQFRPVELHGGDVGECEGEIRTGWRVASAPRSDGALPGGDLVIIVGMGSAMVLAGEPAGSRRSQGSSMWRIGSVVVLDDFMPAAAFDRAGKGSDDVWSGLETENVEGFEIFAHPFSPGGRNSNQAANGFENFPVHASNVLKRRFEPEFAQAARE